MNQPATAFAEWRGLAPADAARRLHASFARLNPAQRRAVLARVETEERCEALFAAASGPLKGIPALAKDLYSENGYACGAGSRFLAEEQGPAKEDAPLLTDWRSAGGVCVGATQLHEFAYGITGENPHFGNVCHPRDATRTSGGSSSGSAFAVAAGLVPLAFGTDTAGSLRVPAAYCGLYAVRFSPGERWTKGVFPLAPSFDTAGWFTATAADLRESLQALGMTSPANPYPLRIGWLPLPGVEPGVLAAQAAAARRLGAETLTEDLAGRMNALWTEAPRQFRALRAPEAWAVHASWFARREQEYDPNVRSRLLDGLRITPEERASAEAGQRALKAGFEALWAECDVLLTPCTPTAALRHEECTQAERDRIFLLTTAVSVAGLPALNLPVALEGGLSTGLQAIVPSAHRNRFLPLLERIITSVPSFP